MMEYVFSFCTLIIGFIVDLIIYKIISKEKIHFNKLNIFLLIIFSVFLTLLNFIEPIMLKLLCSIICICFLIKRFFKEEVLKSFYYAFFIWTFMLLADMSLSILIMNKNLNFFDIFNNFIVRSLMIIPISLIQIILTIVSKKIINNLYEKYFKKICRNIYFIIGLMSLIFYIAFSCCLNAYQSNIKYISFYIIIVMFVVIVLLVYLIKYIIKSYKLSYINQNIIRENKLIREISKNDQIFKHNLINNLLGIQSVTNKKTKLLIEDLIRSYQNDYDKITNINELPQGIQGIIYKKIYLKNIPDLNVIVENTFNDDLSEIMDAKSYNLLSVSIGILLDNSLEAVNDCEDKIIIMNMKKENEKIIFEIKNNFNSVIDFEKIGKANYTSKKNGHGIGLGYILKNRNIEMNTSIINNLYCSTISINNKD